MEEFRVTILFDWMATPPPPPGAAYLTLMACHLVVMDKHPEVRPIGIG